MIVVVDKLKLLISKRFYSYLLKITRGYVIEPSKYEDIINAMRDINMIENFTFPKESVEALISTHITKLRT